MWYLLFFLPIVNCYYLNNWFPIIPISSTNFKDPKQIRLLGKDFVVWKKDNQIILQDDVCPHRCAPLSEGYIDRETNNLRCAYHGWEFNEVGNCTMIPQLEKNQQKAYRRACVKNYPTLEHGNILWGYIGNITAVESPMELYNLSLDNNVFMRELPYSFYILLENFLDPAHIPFAHHKLQSVREKGSPIEIEILSKENDLSRISVLFTEKNEDMRVGMMNFNFPVHYYLQMIRPISNLLKGIHIFIVPVQEDRSRIFISYHFNKENRKTKLFSLIPVWLRHVLTNRFLDSDTLILHKQEKYLKRHNDSYHNTKKYYMPAQSDRSIKVYRRWIKKALPNIPYFYKHNFKNGQELTREEVLDRYNQHTRDCKHCMQALKNANHFQKYGTFIFLGLFAYTRNIVTLLLAILNYNFFEKFKNLFIFQDYVHNVID